SVYFARRKRLIRPRFQTVVEQSVSCSSLFTSEIPGLAECELRLPIQWFVGLTEASYFPPQAPGNRQRRHLTAELLQRGNGLSDAAVRLQSNFVKDRKS